MFLLLHQEGDLCYFLTSDWTHSWQLIPVLIEPLNEAYLFGGTHIYCVF